MAVTPRALGDPHPYPDDATQVVPRATFALDGLRWDAPDPGAGPAGVMDATLVMPRLDRPQWRAVEPGDLERAARRRRNRKVASTALAAAGLIVVVSTAFAVLGTEPGDPTFAGAIPTVVPTATTPSAQPSNLAPLRTAGAGPVTSTPDGTPSPDPDQTSTTPGHSPSSHAGARRSTQAPVAGRRATRATVAPTATMDPAETEVSISSPQDGETVGESVTVSGESHAPDGYQVWLLTRSGQNGTWQVAGGCGEERHFVCDPVTLDSGEDTHHLAVIVTDDANEPSASLARDEVTVHRTPG
ncbi:hypothetical protein AB0F72_37885 [Actinoplanes sp. NPDC023936]|uniref:hypothetical protein n=1 Tax=Actinoplanes sp. NPDC023936 TaxID=3154910 RepID=UPI0033C7EEF9